MKRMTDKISEATFWASIHAAGAFILVAYILVPLVELAS